MTLERRLIDRALAAARRRPGSLGLVAPDAAALLNPGSARVLVASRTGAQDWPAAGLLPHAQLGSMLAVLQPPRPDRIDAITGAGITTLWIAAPASASGASFVQAARQRGLAATFVGDPRLGTLCEAYAHAVSTGRAYVVLKVASSMDGRIATRTGQSKWITGSAARAAGRRLRAQLDAIVVGVETVLADDPLLTARRRGAMDPVRLVLDSRLRTPLESQLVRTASEVRTVLLTTDRAPSDQIRRAKDAGAEVVIQSAGPDGRVSVAAVAKWLAQQGLVGLLVEGGGTVHGAFLDAGLVDRLVWFTAPLLLGGQGRAAVGGFGPDALADALRFERIITRRIGSDWMFDMRR